MTDLELIDGCAKNDASCQRTLFLRYAGKFKTVCRFYAKDALEADDMLQDAFILIFKNIRQFKKEGSFEGWMRKIVVNVALRYIQKRKVPLLAITENVNDKVILDPEAYSQLEEETLLQLITSLPEGYRNVFVLYVIEGYSHEEIAQLLKIRPGTSRSQLNKARKVLKEKILKLKKISV